MATKDECMELIVEVQDIAGWANQDYAWKFIGKIYELTTEFLEKEGLMKKEEE